MHACVIETSSSFKQYVKISTLPVYRYKLFLSHLNSHFCVILNIKLLKSLNILGNMLICIFEKRQVLTVKYGS